MIESIFNLRRQVEHPQKYPGNPIVRREHPWDAHRCDLYGTVIPDPQNKKLQMFYATMSKPVIHDDKLAYAESFDEGKTWIKPEFDLFPYGEHKRTNIILEPSGELFAGPCVIRDEHDPDPSRRYKLFVSDYQGSRGGAGVPGMYVCFSPDGIHWDRSRYKLVLPLKSDTGQSAFWDERYGKYVAYVRFRSYGYRAVGRTESKDFDHWSPPELVFAAAARIYNMGVTPYQDIYVATPWIYWFPDTMGPPQDSIMSPLLAMSRDGWSFQFVTNRKHCREEPFLPLPEEEYIPTGPAGSRDASMVRMSSSLVVLEDKILFFYGQTSDSHGPEMGSEIGMATLRLDGFVALVHSTTVSAKSMALTGDGGRVGRLVTKPFVLAGDQIYINAVSDEGGKIKVVLLDGAGKPVPGFKSMSIRGDGVKLPVTWRSGANLGQWRGKPVRLEFIIYQAKLYSFGVED